MRIKVHCENRGSVIVESDCDLDINELHTAARRMVALVNKLKVADKNPPSAFGFNMSPADTEIQ